MTERDLNKVFYEEFGFDPKITMEQIVNPHLYFYTQAAQALGMTYQVLVPREVHEFSHPNKSRKYIVNRAMVPVIVDYVGAEIAKYKNQTSKYLAMKNIPVPKSFAVQAFEELLPIYEVLGKQVVIKPEKGIGGRGITILPSRTELKTAWELARTVRNSKQVTIEEFITGNNYRLLVLGSKVIAIAERLPAYINGDGSHTIQKLIEISNKERKASHLHTITVDNEIKRRLKLEGRTMETIPTQNERVFLRYNCNMSTGGTTLECLDRTHPKYLEIAVKACQAISLEFGGVDLITPDISNFDGVKCAINEINRAPGLRIHYYPDVGRPVNVAKQIWEYILARTS